MTIGHIAVGAGPVQVIALHGWFGAADGWGELPGRMRATWLQQIPSCEVDVIAEAGHYAMYEAPQELVADVEKTFAILD